MTKWICVVAALLFAALEASAGDFVDEMWNSYKKEEGANVITMGKTMLSVVFATADKETKAAIKKINKMTIVALDAGNQAILKKVEKDLATAEKKGAQMAGETLDPKTNTLFKIYIVKEGEYYTHLLTYFKSNDGSKVGIVDMAGRFLESELEALGKSSKPI